MQIELPGYMPIEENAVFVREDYSLSARGYNFLSYITLTRFLEPDPNDFLQRLKEDIKRVQQADLDPTERDPKLKETMLQIDNTALDTLDKAVFDRTLGTQQKIHFSQGLRPIEPLLRDLSKLLKDTDEYYKIQTDEIFRDSQKGFKRVLGLSRLYPTEIPYTSGLNYYFMGINFPVRNGGDFSKNPEEHFDHFMEWYKKNYGRKDSPSHIPFESDFQERFEHGLNAACQGLCSQEKVNLLTDVSKERFEYLASLILNLLLNPQNTTYIQVRVLLKRHLHST